MKLAIITLTDYFNYGNRLQNYALQEVVSKLSKNIIIETVWYKKCDFKIPKKYLTFSNIRRYIFNRHGFRDFIIKEDLFLTSFVNIILKSSAINI